jgi:hypothetical protein
MTLKVIILILIVYPMIAFSEWIPTYNKVLEARKCRSAKNELYCRYDIGDSFSMEISGVGEPDALIVFYKLDIDGGIYARLSALHDCVVVAQALGNYAYISPKTGKVYKTSDECSSRKK